MFGGATEGDTDLLPKILRPVKVLLLCWPRGAGVTAGGSEAEEDEVEVEVEGSSPPSCREEVPCGASRSSSCCSMAASVSTAGLRSEPSRQPC